MKRILIAIPTARYIEADTFKSIYDLEIPPGYETTFQCFYGYRVDQVRNLIADWVVRGFDYLFAVDHDVTFAPDTLKKMLQHDKDLVSGIYRQRSPVQSIEIYDIDQRRMDMSELVGRPLVQIGGCGFGCVLVKKQVFVDVGYPQFEYHVALDHQHTVSEDNDFCRKAMSKGHTLWCDPTILCGHIGSTTMQVELPAIDPIEQRLLQIAGENHLPTELVSYIKTVDIKDAEVIYDIGANSLEWSRLAKSRWPNARVIAFEAMEDFGKLYKHFNFEHSLGVLSDEDGKELKFYENPNLPWGNSYYMENENESPPGCEFNESYAKIKKARTLDSIVEERGWPYPDLIKIDVQGAERDVLEGAKRCLSNCKNLIIELQHKEYNKEAPLQQEMFDYLDSIGFELVTNIHKKECDGDYHFKRKTINVRPTTAYIIRTAFDDTSAGYAEMAEESCRRVGLEPQYFSGYAKSEASIDQLSKLTGFKFGDMDLGAACASASHYMIWKAIAKKKDNEPVIILEHDAVMMHPIDINADVDMSNIIIALGYKHKDISLYDADAAGMPKEIISRKRHSGAHAYMITPATARRLLDELWRKGSPRAIDNFYFMRINQPGDTESEVPLALMVPTPAIGWVRKSTIWEEPSELNYDVHESFRNYLKA